MSEKGLIDITNIDRNTLLKALWDRSEPAAYFKNSNIEPPPFSWEEAKRCMRSDGYLDYVCGRVIKADIYSTDQVNPRLYDRDNGEGAFQEVVNSLG